jgi:hypothetical protein
VAWHWNEFLWPLEARFGRIAAKNIKALRRAYTETEIELV